MLEGPVPGGLALAAGEDAIEGELEVPRSPLVHRDSQRGSALHCQRPQLAWVTQQEDLLGCRPVGDAREVGLGVVQVFKDLPDVVGVHRAGVEPQVAVQVGQARLDTGSAARKQAGVPAADAGKV